MSKNKSTEWKLRAVMKFLTQLAIACSLMVWGAMNLATNVRNLRESGIVSGDDASLFSADGFGTIMLVLLTCLCPIAFGVWMLMRMEGIPVSVKGVDKPASSESETGKQAH